MLIEKAFTKLHGNYKSIAWGSMFESGNIFLGTGGKRIYTSTMTAGQIYSTVADWNLKSYIIGAKGYTSVDGNWHNHFYTLISEHTLSNGVQIFKLRNPMELIIGEDHTKTQIHTGLTILRTHKQ